jgi:hypothetical protein
MASRSWLTPADVGVSVVEQAADHGRGERKLTEMPAQAASTVRGRRQGGDQAERGQQDGH